MHVHSVHHVHGKLCQSNEVNKGLPNVYGSTDRQISISGIMISKILKLIKTMGRMQVSLTQRDKLIRQMAKFLQYSFHFLNRTGFCVSCRVDRLFVKVLRMCHLASKSFKSVSIVTFSVTKLYHYIFRCRFQCVLDSTQNLQKNEGSHAYVLVPKHFSLIMNFRTIGLLSIRSSCESGNDSYSDLLCFFASQGSNEQSQVVRLLILRKKFYRTTLAIIKHGESTTHYVR